MLFMMVLVMLWTCMKLQRLWGLLYMVKPLFYCVGKLERDITQGLQFVLKSPSNRSHKLSVRQSSTTCLPKISCSFRACLLRASWFLMESFPSITSFLFPYFSPDCAQEKWKTKICFVFGVKIKSWNYWKLNTSFSKIDNSCKFKGKIIT